MLGLLFHIVPCWTELSRTTWWKKGYDSLLLVEQSLLNWNSKKIKTQAICCLIVKFLVLLFQNQILCGISTRLLVSVWMCTWFLFLLQPHPDAAPCLLPLLGPAVSIQTRSQQNNGSVSASILRAGASKNEATFSCSLWIWHSSKLCSPTRNPIVMCLFQSPLKICGWNIRYFLTSIQSFEWQMSCFCGLLSHEAAAVVFLYCFSGVIHKSLSVFISSQPFY